MAFTSNKPTNWTLFVAACCALLCSAWYFSSVLADVNNFMDWDKGKEYSSIIKAMCIGLLAFLLAAGVDVKALLGPLGQFIPGTTTTVTESKVQTTEVKVEDNTPKQP